MLLRLALAALILSAQAAPQPRWWSCVWPFSRFFRPAAAEPPAPPPAVKPAAVPPPATVRHPVHHLSGPEALAAIPKPLIDRIRQRHGSFDPSKLSAVWEQGDWLETGVPFGLSQEGDLVIYYDGEYVASGAHYYRNGALRFDIDVDEGYRGTKLYEYLLGIALQKNPGTVTIPARMYGEDSDNADILIKKVFDSSQAFLAYSPNGRQPKHVRKFRQKVYDALYQMPAIKARERNGFGRITKVIFNPSTQGIAFVAEKGPRGPPGDLKIYFEGKPPIEYLSNFTTAQVSPSALSLGPYPDFEPW